MISLTVRYLLARARLAQHEAAAKDAETLILRHQLAIAQWCTPPRQLQRRLIWADRASLTLLVGALPSIRLQQPRLLVTLGMLIRRRDRAAGLLAGKCHLARPARQSPLTRRKA